MVGGAKTRGVQLVMVPVRERVNELVRLHLKTFLNSTLLLKFGGLNAVRVLRVLHVAGQKRIAKRLHSNHRLLRAFIFRRNGPSRKCLRNRLSLLIFPIPGSGGASEAAAQGRQATTPHIALSFATQLLGECSYVAQKLNYSFLVYVAQRLSSCPSVV